MTNADAAVFLAWRLLEQQSRESARGQAQHRQPAITRSAQREEPDPP
jgi:hypothetical protein